MQPLKIRRVDARQDLIPIAELIQTCFATTLDDDGKRYIDYMRYLGENRLVLEHILAQRHRANIFNGYVWLEEGRIIGNVTMTGMKKHGSFVQVLSNIAVIEKWRGTGIATQLTLKALDASKESGALEAWLQVREDNPGAIHMYKKLGFITKTIRSTWTTDRNKFQVNNNSDLLRTSYVEKVTRASWGQVTALLTNNYDTDVDWFFRFNPENHKPGLLKLIDNLFRIEQYENIGLYHRDTLNGVLLYVSGRMFGENAWLGTEDEKSVENKLHQIFEFLFRKNQGISRIQMNLPAGKYEKPLCKSGFHEIHRLIWMSKDLLG